MRTFLTSPKMHAALVLRIEKSLRGKRRGGSRAIAARFVALIRFAVVLGLVVALFQYLSHQRKKEEEFEASKKSLAADIHAESSELEPRHFEFLTQAVQTLVESSKDYPGDVPETGFLQGEELERLLAKDIVYVRARLKDLKSEEAILHAVGESTKDSFLYCLLNPALSTKEKDLIAPVKKVYRRKTAYLKKTEHVCRLQAALVAIELLEPAYERSAMEAQSPAEVKLLREAFAQAPFSEAKRVLRSEVFLFVADEAKKPGAPVEFDGARPHFVRITLVNSLTSEVLFRKRLFLDSAWVSEKRRHRYALGLTDCRLAMDLRQALLRGQGEKQDAKDDAGKRAVPPGSPTP